MPIQHLARAPFPRRRFPAVVATPLLSLAIALSLSPRIVNAAPATPTASGRKASAPEATCAITGSILGPNNGPVEGAEVAVSVKPADGDRVDATAKSKADGTFRVEGLPVGEATIHVMGPLAAADAPPMSVSNPPLIETLGGGVRVTLAAVGPTAIPRPIQMMKAVAVSGRVTDMATGAGIAGVQLHFAGRNGGYRPQPPTDNPKGTDAEGRIQVYLTPNASYQVTIESAPAPYENAKPEPIAVTAPKTSSGTMVWRTLNFALSSKPAEGKIIHGTVLDIKGTPVADVQVFVLRILDPESEAGKAAMKASVPTYQNVTLTTDDQGRFAVPNVLKDEKVTGMVESGGYRYVSGGQVTDDADGSHMAFRVIALDARVRGKVIDAGGKPIVGAQIWSPDGGPLASAVSDASGAFTLPSLPLGRVKVGVAMGTLWTTQSVDAEPVPSVDAIPPKTAPTVFRIVPQTTAMPTAAGLLDALIERKHSDRGFDRSDTVNYVAQTDPDKAIMLARMAHKQGEALPDGVIANLIEDRIKTDPIAAAAWAKSVMPNVADPMIRVRSACEVGINLAYRNPKMAEQWYASCQNDAEQPKAAVDMNRARLVALASLIHAPADEAAHLKRLDGALDGTQSWRYNRTHCAEQVARGDVAAGETLIAAEPAAEKVEFYSELVTRNLKTSPSLSRVYLTKLQAALAADPKLTYQRDLARDLAIRVIAALGPNNPVDALAVARTFAEADPQYPLALATAARYQTEDVAAPLWKTAIDRVHASNEYEKASELLGLASIAASGSPNTANAMRAKTLWAEASASAASTNYAFNFAPRWAIMAGQFDPATARAALERSFANSVSNLNQSGQMYSRYELTELTTAMATVDPARAVALIDAIPPPSKEEQAQIDTSRYGGDYVVERANLCLIKLLTLPAEQRRATAALMVSRFGYDDE